MVATRNTMIDRLLKTIRRDRDRAIRAARWSVSVVAAVLGLFLAVSSPAVAEDAKTSRDSAGDVFAPEAIEFFESRVRPILVDRCLKCHGPAKQSSSLRLDSRAAVLKGGESGPSVVLAKPDQSLLIKAVSHSDAELKMPPSGKLPEPALAALRQWVALGAPWSPDRSSLVPPGGTAKSAGSAASSSTHWAFQPVSRPALPDVRGHDWQSTAVDAFVLARLEQAGIAPSPPADRRTLIRRATIDLWGIPPTAAEVDAFVADKSPGAYALLIDRLLASPRYGERWGRHWLDVARYADTKGYVFTQDRRYPYAYTYRDYVVAAFNADLGYDRFILEQLAADKLVKGGAGTDTRALAAMGFTTVGRRFLLDQNEIIDDRIDLVCRGLLGLTVTCARCHDHKFDPIPSEDYYSLYGVFASSIEPNDLPVVSRPGDGPLTAGFALEHKAAEKRRDDYLAARRDEIVADYKARFSEYLRAAYDLSFQARSPRLDERARAAKLNRRRLTAAMRLWKRQLDATAKANDPILGPWHAFAALPREQFGAKAGDVVRTLTTPPVKTNGLVAEAVLKSTPKTMAEVVERYAGLLARLEARLASGPHSPVAKGAAARGAGGEGALPEPEWEALRQLLFGEKGALALATNEMRGFLDQSQRERLEQFNSAIVQVESTHPGAPARAMVLNDAPNPVEPHVFIRGNPGRPGPAVPRRFLRLLSSGDRPAFANGSGRLELARAIADPKNPLTARVIVNRVWLWHFGKGLVDTASDFGLRSDPPTHPELLDFLASELIASGWSLKALHRQIMLSSAYQERSDARPEALARDPENRLRWRWTRQRLDFESMRDSLLAVSGALEAKIGGPAAPITEGPFQARRTLYGFIDRQNLDGVYRTFDFAVPDATSPRRFVTTVPQQALFLMNGPFLHEQAQRLAEVIVHDPPTNAPPPESAATWDADPAEGVRRLYRRVLLRSPEPDELNLAVAFIRAETDRSAGDVDDWKRANRGAGNRPLAPWEQLSQVLLLTNEFMFVD
jgi:Protein of unknown function (DUF1553)/Protein of unknown function (DUF1549)/Planctomycete cytochrome C